jgi:hypothetical protein
MVISDQMLIRLWARCMRGGKDAPWPPRADMQKLREVVDFLRQQFPKDFDAALRGSKNRVRRERDAQRRAGLEFLRTDGDGYSYGKLGRVAADNLPSGIPRAGGNDNLPRIARDIKSGKDRRGAEILKEMRARARDGKDPWGANGRMTRAEVRAEVQALEALAREHCEKYKGKLR